MENYKLIARLSENYNISQDEAKYALENNNWNIIDAILSLEENNKIQKPTVSIFYTNEKQYNAQIPNLPAKRYKAERRSDGLFEFLCKVIDTCNNIFLEIKRKGKVYIRVPLTAFLILLFFTFWCMVPIIIIMLFKDIEFYLDSKNTDMTQVNVILKKATVIAKAIKEKVKKRDRNG